ncbi:hypothetical protein JOM56_011622 [Amanita muscaria]
MVHRPKILAALDRQEEEEASGDDYGSGDAEDSDDGPSCKSKGQRIGKASSINLSSNIPWINFHEELKMQAGKLYSKPILDDMHNFEINYTIPRNVINSKKKDTTIKVQICELPVSSGKENMDPNNSGSDDEPPKKRQKKGKSSDGTKIFCPETKP